MKRYQYLAVSVLAGVILLGNSAVSQAQYKKRNTNFLPYSSISFGVGTSSYYGDLAGYKQFIKATYIMPRWNLGVGYTRQFTPHFAARASFTWARITGDDYTFNKGEVNKGDLTHLVQYTRNLHFRNDLKEFAISGIYNFTGDGRNSDVRAKFTTYIFGGLALVAHSPEAKTPAGTDAEPYDAQKWVKLQPLHTEGQGQPGYAKPYSLVTVAIPIGFGLRYRLNESFNLGFEIGYRYTFSDYLDDTGGPYVADPTILTGVASKMADRRQQQYDSRYKNAPDRYQVLKDLYNQGGDTQAAVLAALNTPVRGSASVLSFLKDSYLLTSFQIHYIIPTKIKCPPIK